MTDNTRETNEVSTDKTVPADPSADTLADGTDEQQSQRTEGTARRTDLKTLGGGIDAADRRETPPANSWSVNRRTFMKAGTLLGLGSGALGGLLAPGVAQAADPWNQQAKLLAADGAAYDYFGESVSIAGNGNTAIVSAHNDTQQLTR